MVVLLDLNARVGNEMIEGIVDGMECQEEIKVANDYWRCVQSRAGVSGG